MKFLLDESVEYRLAGFLSELGHDVTAIAVDYPSALKDIEVLTIARDQDRILITNDKDFGELVYRQRLAHCGVILLRVRDDDIEIKQVSLLQVLKINPDQLRGFIVISDRGVRIRATSANE
jgi:predicted nuclease of predicted toxin-antitoxin system